MPVPPKYRKNWLLVPAKYSTHFSWPTFFWFLSTDILTKIFHEKDKQIFIVWARHCCKFLFSPSVTELNKLRVISGDFDDVEEGEKDFGKLLHEEITKTRNLRKVGGVYC